MAEYLTVHNTAVTKNVKKNLYFIF